MHACDQNVNTKNMLTSRKCLNWKCLQKCCRHFTDIFTERISLDSLQTFCFCRHFLFKHFENYWIFCLDIWQPFIDVCQIYPKCLNAEIWHMSTKCLGPIYLKMSKQNLAKKWPPDCLYKNCQQIVYKILGNFSLPGRHFLGVTIKTVWKCL